MAVLSCTLLVDDDETTNFLNQALLQRLAAAVSLAVALGNPDAMAQRPARRAVLE